MPKHLLFIFILALFKFSAVYADNVAVIGGGAAGLATAYLTEETHNVTLFEAQDQLGGNAKTENIDISGKPVAVDAGAEFFNRVSYPNFVKLLELLMIATTTFALAINFYDLNSKKHMVLPPVHDNTIEFNSFKPSNLFKLIQLKWMMYRGKHLVDNKIYDRTLKEFLDSISVTENFKNNFIYPLLSAAWGVTIEKIKEISAYQGLKYFIDGESANNEWMEITDGFGSYIRALQAKLKNTDVQLNTRIKSITEESGQYRVTKENGESALFDQVVFAVNPKRSAKLLKDIPGLEKLVHKFNQVKTFDTKIALSEAQGSNLRFLPHTRPQVVNILWNGEAAATTMCKNWKTGDDLPPVLKTWVTHDVRAQDDNADAMPDAPYAVYNFEHTHMDMAYYKAYKAAQKQEGKRGLWFPGIHENDSHESAITAAIEVARRLSPKSSRLATFE